ncbi:hypothetical protein B5S28_g3674 [[Candida] boidinii]|nr:hypothetical protein B5S28_g3674 [[Candida] boidinii]OWB61786.1 hypothetical protein B5S29_g2689 [[Candida] boidinii]OWB72495.1 hypothetical protein B5S31_g2209 [[Candida] boidinii]OWB78443.1 hypothetical protein B5S32_g2637 [[Candida] boidinii]
MPAMSPTMEEGGIVSWKVQEGAEYASGDVLVEVETDKATIAVEAQDDGKLVKILKHDGDKDIKVGLPIAILAEPTDDLATLKLPEVPAETESATAAPTPTPAPEPEAPKDTSESKSSSSTSTSTTADPKQTLFPSVEILLEENGISHEDALAKISATGPAGRILKGDVLAYLGKISVESNKQIASYIESKSHLDLSSIQLREPAAATSSTESTSTTASKEEAPKKPSKPQPVVIEKTFTIELDAPRDEILKNIALRQHNAELAAYATKLYQESDLNDPIFEDLIAPPKNTERFKVDIKANIPFQRNANTAAFDDLFSHETKPQEEEASVTVKLTLNNVADAKERAKIFLSHF